MNYGPLWSEPAIDPPDGWYLSPEEAEEAHELDHIIWVYGIDLEKEPIDFADLSREIPDTMDLEAEVVWWL